MVYNVFKTSESLPETPPPVVALQRTASSTFWMLQPTVKDPWHKRRPATPRCSNLRASPASRDRVSSMWTQSRTSSNTMWLSHCYFSIFVWDVRQRWRLAPISERLGFFNLFFPISSTAPFMDISIGLSHHLVWWRRNLLLLLEPLQTRTGIGSSTQNLGFIM